MNKILVVDDEKAIRNMLSDYLESDYYVKTAENASASFKLMEDESFDLVISDINMSGLKGPELLHKIKEMYPHVKTMLMTAYNVDDYIRMAKEFNVSNIVPKTVPFNFHELDALIKALLTEDIFGLSRYLLSDHTIVSEYCIKSSQDAQDIREELCLVIEKQFGSSGDIKLILDEIITNAIYHAPTHSDGSAKYREYYPITLEPSEYVHIEWGYDSEKYGIGIIDTQGKLSKETVLYKIDRHICGEGLLDESGRGIHMSRLFADRLVINIKPQKKTEVLILNYLADKYQGYKPLYINEI